MFEILNLHLYLNIEIVSHLTFRNFCQYNFYVNWTKTLTSIMCQLSIFKEAVVSFLYFQYFLEHIKIKHQPKCEYLKIFNQKFYRKNLHK